MQHVVTDPSGSVTVDAGPPGLGRDPVGPPWTRRTPAPRREVRAARWAGRLLGSVLMTAPVLVSAGALATVTIGATTDPGGDDGTLVAMASGTVGVGSGGPRITAYPGDAERFFLTVVDARACALPAGVTGPTADGRVRLTVTASSGPAAETSAKVRDDALKGSRIYYSSPDDIVIGFSRTGSDGLAEAWSLTVDVECRTADGSWAPVGSTGPVPVPARADRLPVSVADPLTTDSQVALTRNGGADGRLLEATVDDQPARIAAADEGAERRGPKVLLPSGTGPGLHLLTLRYEGGRAVTAREGMTVPIVNGYAPPSSGAGALSETAGSHGDGGHQRVSMPGTASDEAGDGYATTSVVLGGLSLLLLGTAGGLIWTFHRRNAAT